MKVCSVQVFQVDEQPGQSAWTWKQFPDGEFSRRLLTLDQLATAIPSARLCTFVTAAPGGAVELSSTGVDYIAKHGNLGHKFKP